ncbi:MAG: RNA-splicing ligase RtcB, partial [Pseudomonadota bacterium]
MTEPPAIDGHALIAWGHAPGPWFAQALPVLETARAQGVDEKGLQALARALAPPKHPPRPLAPAGETPCHVSLDAETADEAANRAKVIESMEALLRTPTLVAGAVMPDACPSGPGGTIPVGGVAAA